ncbi:hypothetical protein Sps_01465 [Shewanella psychrophila]|uniref:Uncharacterized protein n=1 Tax=Shewanella psychrophila TaxID=225848 RepID=A0A1S6HM72_9GAMM|nr:hypothetical protein Sps_01465 [Shewanella psychrophila]
MNAELFCFILFANDLIFLHVLIISSIIYYFKCKYSCFYDDKNRSFLLEYIEIQSIPSGSYKLELMMIWQNKLDSYIKLLN